MEAVENKLLERGRCGGFCAGAASMQGRREAMEDRHCFFQNESVGFRRFRELRHFFGIFDGHGGDQISSSLKRILPNRVLSLSSLDHHSISTLLLQIDDELRSPISHRCGSTAIFVVVSIRGEEGSSTNVVEVVLVNVGDSRAVIFDSDGLVLFTTRDHNPQNEEERKRIEGICKKEIESGRILGLGVSRAFGDHYLKNVNDLPPHCQPVTALPDCTTLRFDSVPNMSRSRILLCCDGIFEAPIFPEPFDRHLASFINHDLQNSECDPALVASHLLDKACSAGSGDNLTAILICVDNGSAFSPADTDIKLHQEFVAGPFFHAASDPTFMRCFEHDLKRYPKHGVKLRKRDYWEMILSSSSDGLERTFHELHSELGKSRSILWRQKQEMLALLKGEDGTLEALAHTVGECPIEKQLSVPNMLVTRESILPLQITAFERRRFNRSFNSTSESGKITVICLFEPKEVTPPSNLEETALHEGCKMLFTIFEEHVFQLEKVTCANLKRAFVDAVKSAVAGVKEMVHIYASFCVIQQPQPPVKSVEIFGGQLGFGCCVLLKKQDKKACPLSQSWQHHPLEFLISHKKYKKVLGRLDGYKSTNHGFRSPCRVSFASSLSEKAQSVCWTPVIQKETAEPGDLIILCSESEHLWGDPMLDRELFQEKLIKDLFANSGTESSDVEFVGNLTEHIQEFLLKRRGKEGQFLLREEFGVVRILLGKFRNQPRETDYLVVPGFLDDLETQTAYLRHGRIHGVEPLNCVKLAIRAELASVPVQIKQFEERCKKKFQKLKEIYQNNWNEWIQKNQELVDERFHPLFPIWGVGGQ